MIVRVSYSLFFFLLLFVNTTWAEVAIPQLSKRVTDLTGTLTVEQSMALENKLAAFEAKKGSQIAVLILPTTQPETIEAFGIRLFDAWKIGRKNINDGVILIVAKDDRKLRLEIGRGLEGAIPDAITKRIIAEIITPKFKENDFYGGVAAGVNQIIKLIEGESLPAATLKNNADTLQNNNFADSGLEKPGFIALAVLIGIDFMIVGVTYGGIPFLATILGITTAASIVFFTRDSIVAIAGGFVIFLAVVIFNMARANSQSRKNRGRNSRYSNYWGSSSGSNSSNSWSSSGSSSSSSSSSSSFSGGGGDSGGGGASGSW